MIHVNKDYRRESQYHKPALVLHIDSYAEIFEHEQEILRRIEAVPNGGNLFMMHPFMLFDDIGVELTAKAKEEIVHAEPQLKSLAEASYRALRASKSTQRMRIRLKGLFRKPKRTP